ncbi:MAG: hypothetical protein V7L29_18415 [Nostoc sp.]|uniref:hypothetical protein n=1 Tax=Nostoc sp. TaxID=1180 RepID=UPI002FEE9E63
MAKLTVPPNFIATPGSDTLVGKELNGSPTIGIDILTAGFIYTLSGNDTIKGTAAASIGVDQGKDGTGIANSGSLNTGDGAIVLTSLPDRHLQQLLVLPMAFMDKESSRLAMAMTLLSPPVS